jgi:hypothetical protein
MVLKTKRRVEAPPERPRAVPQLRPPRPVGIGGTVIAELIADEPSPVEQVRAAYDQTMRKIWAIWHMGPLTTDWTARLADDFAHIDARWDKLAMRTAAETTGFERSWGIAVCMLTAPFIAECEALAAELKAQVAK